MKVALTTQGTDLDAEMHPRFGRATYILLVDSETLDFEVIDNTENVNRLSGSGIQAGTLMSDRGAEVLITGYCGPNAMKTLNAAKIKVVSDAEGIARDVMAKFNAGEYTFTTEANADGHWV